MHYGCTFFSLYITHISFLVFRTGSKMTFFMIPLREGQNSHFIFLWQKILLLGTFSQSGTDIVDISTLRYWQWDDFEWWFCRWFRMRSGFGGWSFRKCNRWAWNLFVLLFSQDRLDNMRRAIFIEEILVWFFRFIASVRVWIVEGSLSCLFWGVNIIQRGKYKIGVIINRKDISIGI